MSAVAELKNAKTTKPAMTTKPATPLPWTDPRTLAAKFSIWKGDTQVAACRVVDDTGATVPYMVDHDGDCAQNAAYIVAACNAYPELVAALRDCERALTRYFMDFDHLHPTIQEPLYAARALLAKLGEGA